MCAYFLAEYENARCYCDERRAIVLPVYNDRRLSEKPIPSLAPMPPINNAQQLDQAPIAPIEEVLIVAPELNAIGEVEIKEEIPELDVDQIEALDDVFGDGNESDDDVEIIEIHGEFPQPIQCTGDYLVKRENDKISGNLAYRETVRIKATHSCLLFIYNKISYSYINFQYMFYS